MLKTASTLTVVAALAATSVLAVPSQAAVRIDNALELALPDFVPDLKQHTIFVLDERAQWPAPAGK